MGAVFWGETHKKHITMQGKIKASDYTSPMLEVCEVRIERGYEASGGAGSGTFNPWSINRAETASDEAESQNY